MIARFGHVKLDSNVELYVCGLRYTTESGTANPSSLDIKTVWLKSDGLKSIIVLQGSCLNKWCLPKDKCSLEVATGIT